MSATRNFRTDLTAANRRALRSATALGRVLTVAAAASAMGAEGVKAGPKGGVVKAGAATITTRGGSTTINQAGQKVVIDWDSFDIDAKDAVNFLQPGKDSIALNRVLNDLPTNIRGQLTANGNVWIVNQHGVTFHAGAMVNVGSLIATTADIDNADFMAGNYKFDKPGDPNARIINEGDITFGEAGLAAFVAPSAMNRGVIAGRMGKVVIAGNETFAVDLAGDGMWAFTMGEGANSASASNSGRIHNPGGYILISARVAQGMVDSNISVGGVVEATTARVEGGKIVLSGDGFVEVSGELNATGTEAGQVGGSIEVTGDKVHVTASAKIDVSGDAGGGSIKIGGDYQGGGTLKTASRTLVSEGSEIAASAIGQVGDGGEVIVWADEITGFFGSIRATGGANAGDGGFAEVSGKQQLAFDGMVDLGALNGLPGELLLDPDDIVIVDGMGPQDGQLSDNEIFAGDPPATFTISNAAIESALATSSVTITATNSITQNADATIDFQTSANNLSLNTDGGPILLQTTIDAGAGGLTLRAGSDLTVSGAIVSGGALDFDAGSLIILNSAISSTTGNVSLTANTAPTGTVSFGAAVDGADIGITTMTAVALGDVSATGSLTVTSGGAITQTAASSATDLATFNTSGDTVTLTQADNAFGSVAVDTTFTGTTSADVSITEVDATELASIGANALTVNSGGAITDAVGSVILADAASSFTTLDDITLDAGAHDFDGVVSLSADQIADFSSTGGVTFGTITTTNATGVTNLIRSDAGVVAFNGLVTIGATSDFTIQSTGNVTQTGSIITDRLTIRQGGAANTISLTGANDVASLVTNNTDGANASILLTDVNGVDLAGVSAGSLTIDAGAAVTDSAANTITTATSITATGIDFSLDEAGNSFGVLSLTGANVSVLNLADLVLGSVDLSGALVVNVTGGVTQGATSVAVGGTTSITAADDIVLASALNELTGEVTLSGEDVSIANTATVTLTLGAITAADNTPEDMTLVGDGDVTVAGGAVRFNDALTGVNSLTVNATGMVSQGAAISVTGDLDVNAAGQTVSLNDGSNDFQGAVNVAAGSLHLSDANALMLNDLDLSAYSSITAGTAITQSAVTGAGNAIDASEVNLTASSGAISLGNTSNDFGAVQTSATDSVLLGDRSGVTLQSQGFSGSLTVNAMGDISDDDNFTLTLSGPVYLNAGTGAITFNNDNLDFQGVVEASGASVSLDDDNNLAVGAVTASTGAASLSADDTLTINTGETVQGDSVSLAANAVVNSGTITAISGGIDIDATTTVISTGQLNAATTAAVVDIDVGGTVQIAGINAAGVSIATTSGDVTQTGGSIVATEASDFTATGSVTINSASNDFRGAVGLSGAQANVRDVDGLVLGDVDVATLTVNASGTITQAMATSLTVTSSTSITTTDDIVLANTVNAIAGSLSLSGEDINLDAGGNVTLDAIMASSADNDDAIEGAGDVTISGGAVAFSASPTGVNDLDVIATGGISQTAPILITGDADLSAPMNTIDLAIAANDFQGQVKAAASSVTLFDANNLELGLISADTLIANAGGDITDQGAKIEGRNAASFTAAGDINIDALNTHVFTSGVSLSADQIIRFAASGDLGLTSVTATNMTDVVNRITATDGITLDGAISTAGVSDLTLETADGDILKNAGALATDVLTVDVGTGDATFITPTVDVNTLSVTSGASVSLTVPGGLTIGSVNATNLTISAGDAIVQETGSNIDLDGLADFMTTGGTVTLTEAGNDFTSVAVDTTDGMNVANIQITDTDGFVLGDISAASLTIIAGGDVTQLQTTTITATGTTTLSVTGGGVVLEDATNDFATVTGLANAIALRDANTVTLEALIANAGSVTVSTAGDVTVATNANISASDDVSLTSTLAGSTVSVTGTTQITADSDANDDGDVTLRADGGFVTANAAAAAISGVNVTLDGGVVATSATITAMAGDVDVDADGAVTLNGAVTATTAGSTVTIDAGGDIVVTTINANAISAETSSGAINQTSGAITTADGADVSDFEATTNVTLDQAGNDFGGPTELSGQSVTIRDTDALVLDDVTATGTFVVNAGGAVSQNGTNLVTVTETATITATGQNIDLSNDNDFRSTFVATGTDVKVTDTGAIELGAISASTLTIEAGGAVSQSAAATVANDTTVTATGQTVDLDNAANAFTGVVNVTGGAVEIDNSIALGLGDITGTTLDAVAATGNVTNSADDVLSVTGTTTITSTAGSVNIASNGVNSEDLRQTVTLSAAGDVSLTGVNSQKLVLGGVTSDAGTVTVNVSNQAIDLTGDVSASMGGDAVTLRSAGAITQNAGGISASELTVDSDGNAVSLTTATNDIDTLSLGVNSAVTVVETDGLAIGQEVGGSQSTLTLRSTGAITQASSLTVTNNAGFVTQGASITLNAAGNAFGSVSADTTYNMAAANSVTINEADVTVISGITATNTTVTSGGAISQTGAIDASADSSFTASGDITLTDAANDFADTGSGSTATFSGATVNVIDVDTLALGNIVSSASTTITADDAGASGNFSGGLTELRFFDTEGDMVLSSALVLPATVVNFTADSVGAIDAQSLTLTNANTLLDATTSVAFSTGAGSFASLTVNAPGGLSQTAPITVSGVTDLNAPTSQIALGNAANDFQGRVDAEASAVTLFDANNLELALINSDTLIANAGGDITDQGAKIEARNYASFTALDDIIIDTLDTHVFNGGVSLSADQITRFAAKGPFSFGAITATNATDVTNRITVTGGFTLDGVVSTAGLSDLTLDTTDANILQNSGTLTTDVLTLNLRDGDGTFTAGTNDVNTLTAPAATNVALLDINGLRIGVVDAATLTVAAGDAIDQAAGSTIALTGLADLTATGANITLDEATNDFAAIDAAGADLTFKDANDVVLADIDASGALIVEALTGTITDGDTGVAGQNVNVTGTATLSANGAITLDDATNDFGQAVAAAGASVTLKDANGIILGDIDTAGALVVEAVTGSIADNGDGAVDEDINAATAMLTAATTITLDDASNDFSGEVNASASAITLNDINSLELGDIDAMTLTASAASLDDGDPAMGVNGDADVVGTATLTARTGDITLDDATNDFGVVNANGATITLTDRNAVELGDIEATTLVVAAASISDGAEGASGADINVSAETTLTATTTITLDDATNDFGGVVAASGTAITLRDANSIILGDIDAGGALIVEAVSGAITQNGDGAVGGDIDAMAAATFTATDAITLTDASNDFRGAVNASGGAVSLVDLNAVELADIDASALTVTAASIDDGVAGAADADVNVTGETALTASTTITLDDATNDFGGAVSASGATVTLRDANSIVLGDIDSGGALTVNALAGAITQNGDGAIGEDIDATAGATFTATDAITLTDASNDFQGAVSAAGGDVSLVDLNAIELADIDAVALTVSAASIDDGATGAAGADVNVTGATMLTASTTITLNDATNDFGQAVSASGTTITLRDANSIILGDIDAGGVLTVQALTGAISQDGDGQSGEDINAVAEANLTAATTITLTDASNDFSTTVNADGTDVAIRSLGELQLGDIEATSLDAKAAIITDGATSIMTGGDINVTGTTTLTAIGTILLNDTTNDFGQAVSFNGQYVTLTDANNIVLGGGVVGGTLEVTAAGSITDSAGSAISVDGASTLTAQDGAATFDIALDNDTAGDRHDFRGAVSAIGQDITLIDRSGITLGTVTTSGGAPDNSINADGGAEATDPGELIVIARGGAITQDGASALTVTGDTTLEAADGVGGYFDITLTNSQNAFDSDDADAVGDGDTAPDSVTFLGETVTITDTGPFFVFDSVANAGGVLTSQTGDLTIERLRVNAATGPLVGIAVNGAIDADDLSGGSITLGGAGSSDGAATASSGVVTVDNFAVGALAVASDVSTTLTNGDAGGRLRVAAPLQTFTFVTADAFTDGVATNFNDLTGSTADQLILERIAFDGDITIAAGDVDLGHIVATDGFFVTALTGDISKRADADLDFAGSAATGFTVAGTRGAVDGSVTLQGFDTLLSVGGAASFTATSGNVIITRGQNGVTAKEVDLQGPVSVAATDAAIEDQNSLILGQVAVGDDFAIRINTDNANAGAETLTQTATQTITVGGDLALITGVGVADRSSVTLTAAGNSFNAVSALANDLSIRGADAFSLQDSDLTGDLTIGTAAAQHGGGLILQDVQLDGDLAFDATGATILNQLNAAGVTGQSGDGLTVTDLNAGAAVNLTTTGGDLTVTDVIIGTFDFDSAGALTATNLSTTGSADGQSTAMGDITVTNFVSASNASFDSTGGALDIDSARIGTTLTLSASGDITLGAIATGADLSATSDTASVLIRDAAGETPADIVVDGVQSATIGFASGPLVGDIANDRVIETFAGTATQTVDPADFTLQLAIGGDAAFNAAGSVLLPREATAEGGFQNDFMGDVAISATSGDVVIEDTNALSFATVTINAGDLFARSNADNTGGGEGISQTAAIAVGGTASFVTGDHGGAAIADEAILADVTLGFEANDFTGAVSVVADNATLADANSITVANTRVANALGVDTTTAAAGDVTALTDAQSGGATTITSGGSVDLDRVFVGGALTATGRGEGLTANDLAVTGATTLTAETTITVDDALLANATITAGASGALSDVSAQVINVETGGVTISGLSATTTMITSNGPADIEEISTAATTITTADSQLALSQAEIAGPLTARTGTGAIALADVNVAGDAVIDGGAISSDASGGGETRMRITGALDLDGAAVDLTDLLVLGGTTLDATGTVTLDDALFANLTANADGALTITDAGAATTALTTGDALSVTNMRFGALSADAVGTATLEAVQITGAADIFSSDGDIRLGSVKVGGALGAEAATGSVTTFNGTSMLGEVAITAPTAVALPAFTIEGPTGAAIGVEAALANSPADEIRVEDAVTAVADQTNPTLSGDQAISASLAATENADTLQVTGTTTITAANDLTLNDAGLTDATLIAGGAGRLSTVAADELSVTTGGALIASNLIAGATDLSAGARVNLDNISLAVTNVTSGGTLSVTNGQTGAATLSSARALTGTNLRTGSLSADAVNDVALDAMQINGDAAILSTSGDIGLGSVAVAGQLTAESVEGAIRTTDSDFALATLTIAAPTSTTTGLGASATLMAALAPSVSAAASSQLVGEETNTTLLSVGGDAYFLAEGDIALVDDAVGVTGDNDFMGGVTAISGGSVILNDVNDLILGAPTGVAAPGGGAFASTGITAADSLRVKVAGSITDADAPQAVLTIGGDALLLADGDILLDNETHSIGGAIAAMGQNITLTEVGSINLGPVNASGDLMVEAGANNGAEGGATGDAAIIQDRVVMVANADVGGDTEIETSSGSISVIGVSTFATGLDRRLTLDSTQLTGNRDLVLDSPANSFGDRLNIARISGDATITENSQPGATSGDRRIGNFEIGGTTRLTTTNNIVFLGRMTALLDDAEDAPQIARPSDVEARSQGDLNIADEDLRLFIATGESLIIDTTGGEVKADGANVRFDRAVDGDNDAAPMGSASITNDRDGLGGLAIGAGKEGEIRFRDFVGAQNPLGDVTLSAGDIFAGFTFESELPDLITEDFTPDDRFLFDKLNPQDFFFARALKVNAQRRIEFLTPFRTVENFILLDQYFAVNVASLEFGGLDIGGQSVGPKFVQSFGFIGNDRTRSVGLFPRGPQGGNFQFNDCVIGDVADCTNIPIPNVVNNILTPAPPLLGIDTEDLLELFGSFGNEELWGVPQSYYSDLGVEPENKPDSVEKSDDDESSGS